jgi:hypothetical protein
MALAASSGCGWFQPTQHLNAAARPPDDLATGVSVVGTPFHRMLVGTADPGSSTRLVILYIRIENGADEAFWIRPADITLVQADGTIGTGLDRERTLALLERRELVIVDADPAARDIAAWDRTRVAQEELRIVIRDELLNESEVSRDASVRGYLIVDMQRAQATLDGATLSVGLTRLDGGGEAGEAALHPFESGNGNPELFAYAGIVRRGAGAQRAGASGHGRQ